MMIKVVWKCYLKIYQVCWLVSNFAWCFLLNVSNFAFDWNSKFDVRFFPDSIKLPICSFSFNNVLIWTISEVLNLKSHNQIRIVVNG